MITENMPFEQYLKINKLNSSSFKDFIVSPVLYKWNKDNPNNDSSFYKIGRAIHSWVLEREHFDHEYIGLEKDVMKAITKFREEPVDIKRFAPVEKQRRGTKAWKELEEKYRPLELMFEEDYKELQAVTILSNSIGKREMLSIDDYNKIKTLDLEIQGRNELTVEFEYRGVECKARFDSLVSDEIYDVKTSSNPYKFERDIINYKYYIQAGWYSIAYREVFGKMPKAFKFVVIPTTGPINDVQIFPMNNEYIDWGISLIDAHIDDYRERLESGDYTRDYPVVEVFKPSFL